MDNGVEDEFVGAATGGIVHTDGAVPGHDGHVFPGLEVDKAQCLPGEIRGHPESADIAVEPQSPLVGPLEAVSGADDRVHPTFIAADLIIFGYALNFKDGNFFAEYNF